jgi:hypothetical protein
MFGIAAAFLLVLSFIMSEAGWGSGHFSVQDVFLAGAACLAIHLVFTWGHRAGSHFN